MIFRHIILIVFCLFNVVAFSQVDAPLLPVIVETLQPIIRCDEGNLILINPNESPEYEGGQKALFDFIKENLLFPNPNLYCDYTGTVYIGFTVTKEGKIVDVKVKRGLGVAFNDEAIRLVKLTSGKWKAGKQNGRLVNVAYTIPIKFKLE